MMPPSPRGTFTIVRIPVGGGSGKVPLRLHFTLLIALPWFAAGFAPAIAAAADAGPAASWALGALLATLLFVSVTLHELSHTLVGVRLGARVRAITLMFLGGVSEVSKPPPGNGAEMAMAAAGPALSLLLALGLALVARLTTGMPEAVLGLLARVNLVSGVFNLLPAYPLDGGRILRGALAVWLGHTRATIAATIVGRIVAVGLAVIGVMGGLLVVSLIAVFVFFAASMEARVEMAEVHLRRVPVAQLMEPAHTIEDDATVEAAAERLVFARSRRLVVERGEAPVGVVDGDRVERVPWAERPRMPVALLMEDLPAPIAADASASEALRRMGEERVMELPVVGRGDGEGMGGHLVGVVRIGALQQFVLEEEERDRRQRGGKMRA